MAIIDEANRRKDKKKRHKIRLVANAAGGLLPSVAEQLRQTFGGPVILPGYGMTECMPISCPPADYKVRTYITEIRMTFSFLLVA